jgi:hypothetical protein
MAVVHLDHIGHKLWQRTVAVQSRDTSCCRDEPRAAFAVPTIRLSQSVRFALNAFKIQLGLQLADTTG